MGRGSIHRYYAEMLQMVAQRSTCARRKVGAIITDGDGKILGTGYNGVPKNYPHCIDTPCPGVGGPKGDTSNCMAVHAEQNAIVNCADLSRARFIYCSCLPCFVCMKMLLNTPIDCIVYLESYADARGLVIAEMVGKNILHYPSEIS